MRPGVIPPRHGRRVGGRHVNGHTVRRVNQDRVPPGREEERSDDVCRHVLDPAVDALTAMVEPFPRLVAEPDPVLVRRRGQPDIPATGTQRERRLLHQPAKPHGPRPRVDIRCPLGQHSSRRRVGKEPVPVQGGVGELPVLRDANPQHSVRYRLHAKAVSGPNITVDDGIVFHAPSCVIVRSLCQETIPAGIPKLPSSSIFPTLKHVGWFTYRGTCTFGCRRERDDAWRITGKATTSSWQCM